MSQRYALIIGNSEYSDSRLSQLVAPGKDVEELSGILKDASIGGFDEVITLLNEPADIMRRAVARFFTRRNLRTCW